MDGIALPPDMEKPEKVNHQHLLMRLSKSDPAAFDELFLEYYAGLLRFARSHMPYPSDGAEDIVADVLGYLWQNRSRLDIRGSLAAYLYRAVKNNIIKEFSRSRFNNGNFEEVVLLQADSSFNEPDSLLAYKELNTHIQFLIGKLPDRTRLVFLMNRDNGLTYLEISDLLGISINSVKTHMYRALLFLKVRTFTSGKR